jgi:dienelactone hydrolase
MHTRTIDYTLGDVHYTGYLAVDETTDERRPGVLICHEGTGLDDNARDRADRLAAAGYVAFALDYYGEALPQSGDELMAFIGRLMQNPLETRAIAQAGLDVLLAQPQTDPERVAAIGFCFGGTMALELARGGANLRAVVGFHSGLATARPEDTANIKGSVLVCIGSDDQMINAAQREAFVAEMAATDVDWRLELYGGAVHSFTNPQAKMPGRAEYHEPSDRRSWRSMTDLFTEVFAR